MTDRVAQLDDDVWLSVTLPPTTEEWAEEMLAGLAVEVERDDDGLHVTYTVRGNCNAVENAASFMRDLADAFSEGDIDPMAFTLKAWSTER